MQTFQNILASFFVTTLTLLVSFSAYGQKYCKHASSYNYQRGIEEASENNLQAAKEAFLKEIDEHPDNGHAQLLLSYIVSQEGQYGEALERIDKAFKLIPKKDKQYRAECYNQRAKIFREIGKDDEALKCLSQSISIYPKDENIYDHRAQIYYEREQYDLADADYQKMKELNSNDVMAYMGLGRNENARKNYQNAIDLFDNVVTLYPDYSSGYSFRAEAYVGLKQWNDAANDVIKALEIDYDNKAFGLMLDLADSAFIQISTKLKAQAVIDALNGYWRYCLGIANEKKNNFSEAIEQYTKSNNLSEDAVTHSRIALCYQAMGEWKQAIEQIDNAIRLEPEDTDFIMLKSDILFDAGRLEEAITILDEYIERNPDYAYGYYRRGWYKDNLREIDGAIDDYTMSITLNPDYSYAFLSRGNMYKLKGQEELAAKDFDIVIQKDTIAKEGTARMYALLFLGHKKEAIDWMNQTLASSKDAGIRYDAACLYSLMGEWEKSLGYIEEALQLGYKGFNHIMTDDDLENLRLHEEFNVLIKKYMPKAELKQTTEELVVYDEKVIEVPFTRQGGITKVKCNINDLPLHFVFDTGASTVSISSLEATFMYKNEILSKDDILGKANFIDANGDISLGTIINLRKVTFGGLELNNVRASVVANNNAPLLLGQSVLNRLGKIEIDYEQSVLKITTRIAK